MQTWGKHMPVPCAASQDLNKATVMNKNSARRLRVPPIVRRRHPAAGRNGGRSSPPSTPVSTSGSRRSTTWAFAACRRARVGSAPAQPPPARPRMRRMSTGQGRAVERVGLRRQVAWRTARASGAGRRSEMPRRRLDARSRRTDVGRGREFRWRSHALARLRTRTEESMTLLAP